MNSFKSFIKANYWNALSNMIFDHFSGELPRAYVVRKNRNVMEQSIIDWVAERVAPHKKLGAGVMFVETLPKNQTGKILRRELKAQVFKGSFGY